MILDVSLNTITPWRRNLLGSRALYNLPYGKILPFGMFSMKERRGNPRLIGYTKTHSRSDSQVFHNSKISVIL
jgi:hypothetical protein